MAAPTKKKTSSGTKLRIRVQAYESRIIDTSMKQIIDTAKRMDSVVVGPVPLPTKIKKHTINRATFVFKDSREQFERRVHTRIVDILNPSPQVIEALSSLSLPPGVAIEAKLIS